MTFNTLLAASFITNVIAVIFLISSIVLILIVLIQKGKGGGLSSAFAGGMASGLLGSKTGDVLTWITIGAASVFVFFALILNKWWKPTGSGPLAQTPAPVTSTDTGQGRNQGQQEPTGQPQPQAPRQ
ncbi:MAG: preprotein translocase subunit SecG [Sedimentisphaerales bacterium]